METAVRRKLIDIKEPVFRALSLDATRHRVSLKRHIENILEQSCSENIYSSQKHSAAVNRLMGSARKPGVSIKDIEDERLQYLLSK